MKHDSRVQQNPPAVILCQHEGGGCAACCGAHNFQERDAAASHARFLRRTQLVDAANFDQAKLLEAKRILDDEEGPARLLPDILVCAFAGYIKKGHVGCLLHPTRHPDEKDLRDLGAHNKEICAGHFCASHDWLRPRDIALARRAPPLHYGEVVADASLLKAILAAVDERAGETVVVDERFVGVWHSLIAWPYRDKDPLRFGAFVILESGLERQVRSAIDGASKAEERLCEVLGTRALSAAEAKEALGLLRQITGAAAGVVPGL